jgi:RNA polymerase sigma factor (sigma-70 family)
VDEAALVELAQSGDRAAIAELLSLYDGIIAKSVRRFAGVVGVDKDDLMQYGRIAMLKAISTYDPDKGVKLTTWAYVLVSRYVAREVRRECLMIRVPFHWRRTISVWRKKSRDIGNSREKDPSELADVAIESERLLGVFRRLEPRRVSILNRRALGLSCQEIADQEGVSKARIADLVRESLQRIGAVCPEALYLAQCEVRN